MSKHVFKEHQRAESRKDVDMEEVESTALRATVDDVPMTSGENVMFNSHRPHRAEVGGMNDSDEGEQAEEGKWVPTASFGVKSICPYGAG